MSWLGLIMTESGNVAGKSRLIRLHTTSHSIYVFIALWLPQIHDSLYQRNGPLLQFSFEGSREYKDLKGFWSWMSRVKWRLRLDLKSGMLPILVDMMSVKSRDVNRYEAIAGQTSLRIILNFVRFTGILLPHSNQAYHLVGLRFSLSDIFYIDQMFVSLLVGIATWHGDTGCFLVRERKGFGVSALKTVRGDG